MALIQSEWREAFCGREAELGQLVADYDAVAAGNGPRLVVICADRGMGKTRLVQELYRYLCNAHDPDDYWPDASLFNGNNLRVAPDFNDPHTQAHFASFTLSERPMRFLWWGFRLGDPQDRNAVRSDMVAHRRTLDPHLERARFAREHASRHAAIRHSAADTAKDAALKIGEALLESVPGVGLSKNLIEVGLGVFRTARAHRETRRDQEAFAHADLARVEARRVENLYERTLEDLATLLEPADGCGRVPVVVFCDDAQFAREGGDEGALRFLQRLWDRSREGGWPMLLVATHWAVDWEQDPKAADSSFAKVFRHVAEQPQFATVVTLSRSPGLAHIVQRALPELPAADARLLVEKADGNPQVLIELLERVKASPAWRTADGALSAHGRKQIAAHSCNLTTLITERLLSEATPAEVRVALALASVQGMQFLRGLTEAVARQLEIGDASKGLAAAESPLRLIVGIEEGVASFVQRAYREASAALIETQLGDPEEIKRSVLHAALHLIEPGDSWDRLAQDHQKSLLGLVGSLASDSSDAPVRAQAAQALLRLLSIDTDIASRVRHARLLLEGMGSRWPVTQFEPSDIDAIGEALDGWDGIFASVKLDEVCVRELRPAAAADFLSHGRKLVHALLRLAEHRGWHERYDEAVALVEEAIDTARRLQGQDPSFGMGDLAEVLQLAWHGWDLRGPSEAIARWENEELALRRAHFEAAGDAETCSALVAALNRQTRGREAAEARAMRSEALAAARRLCGAAKDSEAAQEANGVLCLALAEYLEATVGTSDAFGIGVHLPSRAAAAEALPLIAELVDLSSGLPEHVLPPYALFHFCVVGALAANRCGEHAARQRLLQRSYAIGEIDPAGLAPEVRSTVCSFEAIRALLEQDFARATTFAQRAAEMAAERRNWHALELALAFAHRLAEQHLMVLVEPDPSDDDRRAVLPDLLTAMCAESPSWSRDATAARAAYQAIERLMSDVQRRELTDSTASNAVVREVVRAVKASSGPHDCAAVPAEVILARLLATTRTLIVATRAADDNALGILWQEIVDVFEVATQDEWSVSDLTDIWQALDDLSDSLAGTAPDREAELDFLLLRVLQSLAERSDNQWYQSSLAFRLGICAFRCMQEDDLDQASVLLHQAYALCSALLAEDVSTDNLNEMRRNLEAKEALARRRGDAAAEHEAQLERLATLRRLVVLGDNPERARELDELAAALRLAATGFPAVH